MYILDFILQSQDPVSKIECLLFTVSLAQAWSPQTPDH